MSVFQQASTPPVPDLDSAAFWEGCRERRLLVRVCADCGRGHYPPGPCCPWCTSWNIEWREAAPQGTVRTFVIFRHPFLPQLKGVLPYAMLRVILDGLPDVMLHGRLVGSDPDQLRSGQRVEVAWEEAGGGYLLPNWRRTG